MVPQFPWELPQPTVEASRMRTGRPTSRRAKPQASPITPPPTITTSSTLCRLFAPVPDRPVATVCASMLRCSAIRDDRVTEIAPYGPVLCDESHSPRLHSDCLRQMLHRAMTPHY